jgi:AraC-like DNA-binding protein
MNIRRVNDGFADQSHFTRTFKRQTGLTPADYRKMIARGCGAFQKLNLVQDGMAAAAEDER